MSSKNKAPALAPDGTQIFKATYSGVPVYEMICKTVAVMRRRSDSWLNATQILKVAGFDKPQRTRVLEREVQKGEHEKVQGGYGKYQGTWVPIERGLALSRQYNVEALMRPIIDYVPTADSPPLAPKHLTAPPRPKKQPIETAAASVPTTKAPPKASKSVQVKAEGPSAAQSAQAVINTVALGDGSSDIEVASIGLSGDDESMTASPSHMSSSSRTPSPIGASEDGSDGDSVNGKKRKFREGYIPSGSRPRHSSHGRKLLDPGNGLSDGPERYGDMILDYFISETSQIPAILISPPADFDPNVQIDDDGHTALHWACAMGRIRVVKLLLSAGADIFRVNAAEQTALMRSVMFSNNYDVRKFPELYELLHRSTLNIDRSNRTVFHHIADVALSKGKTHAARYYMETILTRLSDYPSELADVINFQDEEGETALTLAARARSKRLVKALLDHGADPKLANRDGKTAEDYILEDERFRSSPLVNGAGGGYNNGSLSASLFHHASTSNNTSANGVPSSSNILGAHQIYHSPAAQRAGGRCTTDMASLLASLAKSFDAELHAKERDLVQANALLNNIEVEVSESKRTVADLQSHVDTLDEKKAILSEQEVQLRRKIEGSFKSGWINWKADLAKEETTWKMTGTGSPDLVRLHSMPATSAESEIAQIRKQISLSSSTRKTKMDQLVQLQTQKGASEKVAKYRRILAAACGGVTPEEVDSFVEEALQGM